MPTTISKSAAEYRERAKKLRLAAENSRLTETRHQLLLVAEDYENLAENRDLIDRHAANWGAMRERRNRRPAIGRR